MEMIIAESGVSTGGVYRQFRGKDEIIAAAVTSGTVALLGAVLPIVDQRPTPAIPELIRQVLAAVTTPPAVPVPATSSRLPDSPDHAESVRPGRASVHGWSHAQADARLGAEVRAAYLKVRRTLGDLCRRWIATGELPAGTDPDGVAEMLTSVILGFIAQRSLVGDADPVRHERAFVAMLAARMSDHDQGLAVD